MSPMHGPAAAQFVREYVVRASAPDAYPADELGEACRYWDELTGGRGMPVQAVRLFADYLVCERAEPPGSPRPDNLGELVARYADCLNRRQAKDGAPDETVWEPVGRLAWEWLLRGDASEWLLLDQPSDQGDGLADPGPLAESLSRQLGFVRTASAPRRLQFMHRPAAEYLASEHLIARCGRDDHAWRKLMGAGPSPGSARLTGLGQALLDCSIRLSDPVAPPRIPEWVIEQIERRLEHELPQRSAWRRDLRLRQWIRQVLEPDSPHRTEAIDAFAKRGPDAARALPSLLRALNDARAEIGARHAVLTVLGLLGEAARPATPALLGVVRERTEHLFLRLKAIDLLAALAPDPTDDAWAETLRACAADRAESDILRQRAQSLLDRLTA